jgi:hypothetical protein
MGRGVFTHGQYRSENKSSLHNKLILCETCFRGIHLARKSSLQAKIGGVIDRARVASGCATSAEHSSGVARGFLSCALHVHAPADESSIPRATLTAVRRRVLALRVRLTPSRKRVTASRFTLAASRKRVAAARCTRSPRRRWLEAAPCTFARLPGGLAVPRKAVIAIRWPLLTTSGVSRLNQYQRASELRL